MTHMNRRLALLGLSALVLAPAAYAQQTAPVVLDGAARAEGLALANRSLNAVQRLQGRFMQTSPGGGRASF